MFTLNSNHHGDTTIKRLNFDLFYKGYPIFVARIIQIQNVISQLIFEIILKMKQQQHDINLRRTRKKNIRVPDGI